MFYMFLQHIVVCI